MLERTIFSEEHAIFRQAVRRFVETEVAPHTERWEEAGCVDRALWTKAGQQGLLCPTAPPEVGGPGADFLYNAIIAEELMRVGASGPGFAVHSDIVMPYLLHHGSEALKQRFIPKMVSGELVGAICMTEPDTGSDLQGIKTTAVRDGDEWVLNGSKTFVTNGQLCELIVVVAKTDPKAGAQGTSLFVVEADRAGVKKGRNLKKVGLKAQDTSEIFLEDVRIPADQLLGHEGAGFMYLMQELPQERLSIAVMAVQAAESALEWTLAYTKERKAFGRSIAKFQNSRFQLAEMATEVTVGRVFVDRCLELHVAGKLDVQTAAMAKLWTTEMQCRVLDACVQLHGGYGYMWEYPIARGWADSRVQRIYGGTSEIMKEIIGRTLVG